MLFGFVIGLISHEVGAIDALMRALETNEPVTANALFNLGALVAWIPFEAGLLATKGVTFGRLLFGLRVIDRDGEGRPCLPGYRKALKRSLLVWVRGLGLGIPILGQVTMAAQYFALKRQGETSWDEELGTEVRAAPRSDAAVVNLCVLVVAMVAGAQFFAQMSQRPAVPGATTPPMAADSASDRHEVMLANPCADTVWVAVAYSPGSGITVSGWYRLEPGAESVLEVWVSGRGLFIYLEGEAGYWPGSSEPGALTFPVHPREPFDYRSTRSDAEAERYFGLVPTNLYRGLVRATLPCQRVR